MLSMYFTPILAAIGFVLTTGMVALGEDAKPGPVLCDPTKIVGHEQCAKCHEKEVRQWMGTPHYATFDALHRTPEAKQISKRLGLRSIKRNDTCTKCHYTRQNQSGRLRVVAGVSCESCHGAAADWLAIHNDYGGEQVTKAMESAEHRQLRLTTSIAAGMNNPHNVYLIARQCYHCHTVPDESLVNVGGHRSGSQDFELVAWSQGMVRHNFLRTGGTSNGASSPAQLRVMYVVGTITDLEYSLRATAQATQKAPFGHAAAQRAVKMKNRLLEIQAQINDPTIQQALDATNNVELTFNNGDALRAAADKISKAAYAFAEKGVGSQLAPIDSMLPNPSQYKQ